MQVAQLLQVQVQNCYYWELPADPFVSLGDSWWQL
jgi:hypothetical protein